jgi:Holliday junction resolvase
VDTYSWREFGRDAEFVVASYLKSKGWDVRISKASRGAADIVASKEKKTWCIQVKASTKSPHIMSHEIQRLKNFAMSIEGDAVFATVQPWQVSEYGVSLGSYMIFLYSLDNWAILPA